MRFFCDGEELQLFWLFLFICFVCAFKVRLLSKYMPKDLVEMEKGSVVLLLFIMLSSVFIIF